MHLLRSGTVTALDLKASTALYEDWLDYSVVEQGQIADDLAAAWGTPAVAGASYVVMQPISGADIYLRLVEGPKVDGYKPLVTYGWAALEFCVQDVEAVAERMEKSPFEIIGPPRRIEGLDAIYPMQVQGINGEICYFTQINSDLPEFTLPRAQSFIDHLFINVLAASDMAATQRWMVDKLGLAIGRENMEIVYTMLAKAFGTPMDELHSISTMIHEKDVFFEVDQMPAAATVRPRIEGQLPPGIGITTIKVPDISAIQAPFITPPRARSGPVYQDQLAGTVQDPDGALFEIVQLAR
jgi:catechol 2,3-dioxygenase-like lactoylglutathione lyase family enzyme